jgi:pimeloyl-ACP methyl ester carboxylesterase
MRDPLWVRAALLVLVSFATPPSAQQPAPWHDPSPHTLQFVTVDDNVKLEVLDWGGSGRPLVLLAGLGNTAHIFDDFAPKLTSDYHVYGITRRGYGASSVPASGYSADRLGDDVLAVLNALKLNRPVLVGHSIAGEELSSVGTRHPERIAGLIYLDAAYVQAYYDHSRGDWSMDLPELQRNLEQLKSPRNPAAYRQLVQELLQDKLPRFEKDLEELQNYIQSMPPEFARPPVPSTDDVASFPAYHSWYTHAYGIPYPEAELRQNRETTPGGGVGKTVSRPANLAINEGRQEYTNLRVPILAIYAIPKDYGAYYSDPAAREAAESGDAIGEEAQAKAFENGVPSARVVRLPHANHYLFLSNEAEVLREMHAFLASLH